MVFGTIIQKGEKYYTYLKKLFESIDNILFAYNRSVLIKCAPKKQFTEKYVVPNTVKVIYGRAFESNPSLPEIEIIGIVEQIRTIVKISIFAVFDILVFLIPYVIPRLNASMLADNANKIYLIIILLILLDYNMTKKYKKCQILKQKSQLYPKTGPFMIFV